MSRTVHCRYHCAACGSHFSSLNAFEAHRAGDHVEGRYCLDPIDDDRFAVVGVDSRCEMYAKPRIGVTVWTLLDDLERARQRSGGAPESGSEPEKVRQVA